MFLYKNTTEHLILDGFFNLFDIWITLKQIVSQSTFYIDRDKNE